ncbi:MAG TPA: group III truncated hemoglobin [Flavobacterium sp.]|nr:group III truncated hemoglobin [Flavobacterium sp.]
MKKEIENREDLSLLVHTFYDRVRKDEELGPIFNSIITDWDAHLEKITDFWEQHIFGAQKYRGNPIEAHNQVDKTMNYGITAHNFGTWLHYWINTLDELFVGEGVDVLKFKARKMQTVFFMSLVQDRPK